jgi:hypothetical protein
VIQPIETQYKGYRFRSRLEARWAIFFDSMGLQWEYEPEGYILEDGTKYLPDFYMPELSCYAEVKPDLFTRDEFIKASRLPKLCLLLDFAPANRPYYVAGLVDNTYQDYLSGNEYGRMIFEESIAKKRIWYLFGEPYEAYHPMYDTERSVITARSARFEYGEQPA